MTTIFQNQHGIILTPSSFYNGIPFYNPVVVNSGVTITDGYGPFGPFTYSIYGQGLAWSILNKGVLSATGAHAKAAVELVNGGTVTNAATGRITNAVGGGVQFLASGQVVNFGTIAAYGAVDIAGSGSVTNAASASMTAVGGVVRIEGYGTVVNSGNMAASNGYGVLITNAATVTNFGTITGLGKYNDGVNIAGGSVTNAASASITGARYGVFEQGGEFTTSGLVGLAGTVKNAGTITGSKGAVFVAGTLASTVVGYGGAVFNGAIIGNTSAGDTLDLKSGSGIGIVSGGVTNFATITVDSGATWKLTGATAMASDLALANNGTLINAGSILAGRGPNGELGVAVNLGSGGVLSNTSGATISGSLGGIVGFGGTGAVVNSGSILGPAAVGYGAAITLYQAGASVTNAASAVISAGHTGIGLVSGGTVTNAGTIAGGDGRLVYDGHQFVFHGDAVALGGTGNSLLVVDPGAVFNGLVAASTSASNTLELASGGSTGTLAGVGTSFVNFGTVTVDSGASWNLTSDTIASGTQVTDGGTLTNGGTISSGITLTGGARLTNAAGATIAGSAGGAVGSGAVYAGLDAGPNTVQNSGTINGGIMLLDGGSVTNAASASITGNFAVYLNDGGPVVNSGTIAGNFNGGAGVDLGAGGGSVTNAAGGAISGQVGVEILSAGAITNAASASITGNFWGILQNSAGAAAVVNSGSIKATGGGIAVYLVDGVVTNAASGSMVASEGVDLTSGGTVTNAGTITGSGGTAVYLGGYGSNRLVVDPGAVFNGIAQASTYATNALELASGGSTGTLAGLGSSFTNFGTVTVDAGASWQLTSGTIASGSVVTDNGTLSTADVISTGVTVNSGAVLTNAAGGAIANAGTAAVYGSGGPVTVVNSGSIGATNGIGIDLKAGGSVTNTGSVSGLGFGGVYIVGSAGTVVNSGSIVGTGKDGVYLLVASSTTGLVNNAAAASITGHNNGVSFRKSEAGTLVNSGSIVGTLGDGVYMESGGSVTNAASASITGSRDGVEIQVHGAAATVTNAGTITGSGGTAVAFAAITTGANRLVVDPGAVFNGKVSGGTSSRSTLELASGGSTGTLTGLGTSFVNFGTETVDSGASWEFTGSNSITSGTTFTNSGTLINAGTLVLSGATVAGGNLVNNGGIVLDPSTLTVTDLTGSGSVTVSSGSLFDVHSGNAGVVTVSSGGTLEIDAGAVAGNTVTVLGGGTLELTSGGALSSVLFTSGSFLEIASGATLSNYATSGGVTLEVASGGTVSGATISSGAVVDVFNGGTLTGSVADNGTLNYDISGSTTFGGTLTGSGTLVVSGGGDLDVVSAYTGAAQIDDTSKLEFTGTYVGGATFSGSAVGSGGTLKFDAGSTGPITAVNSNDTVIAQPGGDNWINSTVSYTLPTNIDTLFLFAGAQGTGNSDASGDALYALDTVNTQTLTGNSANDAFVVYNSSDVVVRKPGSHDTVYAAASYTLPTGIDMLLLEAGTHGVGNSDASGDALYAADAGIAQTLTGNSANDVFVVYNSADVVVPKAGSHDLVYSAINYTLPTGVDVLFLEAGTQAVGNSDAAGDALYAADAGIAQTLTGHSHNDTFVVYNSADFVAGQAGSTDTIYAAANFTLPTNVDTLFLEGNASLGAGNGDAVNALFGNGGVASTLVAGSGADILYVTGTAGTILTGGAGHDTFAFPNAMGKDEVTNFGTTKDTLQFNATLFSNFTAAMSHASQSGANTVFTIDANDTVTLDNVTKSNLTASNFHFS